jgi:hypothetical protein
LRQLCTVAQAAHKAASVDEDDSSSVIRLMEKLAHIEDRSGSGTTHGCASTTVQPGWARSFRPCEAPEQRRQGRGFGEDCRATPVAP